MERINTGKAFGKLLWYDPNPIDNEPINLDIPVVVLIDETATVGMGWLSRLQVCD